MKTGLENLSSGMNKATKLVKLKVQVLMKVFGIQLNLKGEKDLLVFRQVMTVING